MFGKALVLAAWAWGVERYHAFKAKRRAAGVVLRYDAKRNIHYDPLLRMEKRIIVALWIVGVPLAMYAVLAIGLFIAPHLTATPPG
ncbi:hypothetical protein [Novosphingobium sp. fls2-241-R2A-195]|uniref:hypothetical protein n=1 Tax=Novosphingobium sp. fls2-241-R2A-195 TaxID=3040296 RepID=UPI00254DD76B|nr:hypothetical protein [Novosphingobium sp. fls2-241-R2A-195]